MKISKAIFAKFLNKILIKINKLIFYIKTQILIKKIKLL